MNLFVKQAAVAEKRHWVRATRACNNRCIFCHDATAQDGTIIPFEEVCRRIDEGREQGASRLIISGGEPTIHPRFLDLVRYGAERGYSWIQVVSNGRMFGYQKFALKAYQAGLREATFSMHAHRPALYDRLVGVNGAFEQALRGLRNVLALKMVVSVDIVLNRLNLPYLREILEFYMSLGVFEFDLLHLVPFGRGFDEHREEVFADEELLNRELARALELASTPGLYLWTNRMPIRFLEGHEDLFQDPHKIYDEVLGERTSFIELFASGKEPECIGDRCPHCFLHDFCLAARRYQRGEWEGHSVSGTEATSEICKRLVTMTDDELALNFPNGLEVPLREDLLEAASITPDLNDLRLLSRRIRVYGIPMCLGGCPGQSRWPKPDNGVFTDEGKIDPARFIAFFIRRLYMVKSVRCGRCALNDECPGLHVNLARIWGLNVLNPLSDRPTL